MAQEARKYLGRRFDGGIINVKGKFEFSEEVFGIIGRIGNVISSIVGSSSEIQLPEVKAERLSLVNVLIDSVVDFNGRFEVICPVCPDYGTGDRFYRTMGDGVSPEATAGIEGSRKISDIFSPLGFNPLIKIVVADTEDDLGEVIQNCAAGNINLYRNNVRKSVTMIARELQKSGHTRIEVMTFTDLLGDSFRENQYFFEGLIRRLINGDGGFRNMVEKVGEERKTRHSQILGRDEVGYELTIRYMAQYAALGHIVRGKYPAALMNYPTPNRRFYNAAVNINRGLVLDEGDFGVVPVIGTKVKRKNI